MTAAFHNLGSELINKYQRLAGQDVFKAIENASRDTGVEFSYLLEQAQAESNFNADVKAKTSSATGLYQFIDRTWLETVAKHGYKHGLGQYGQHINYDPGRGKVSVSDPQMKKEILELRKDPEIASKMAAEFAKDNRDYLAAKTGADIGSTEMYLAHFLGAGGAAKFINAMDRNEGQAAQKIFPAAAKANRNVFYNKDGSSKSLKDVYAFFDKKFSDTPISPRQAPAGDRFTKPVMNFADASPTADSLVNVMSMDLAGASFSSPPSNSVNFASNSFSDARTNTAFDVMMLSNMIREWTQTDQMRGYGAYSNSGRFV